jgi:hypothetical protein
MTHNLLNTARSTRSRRNMMTPAAISTTYRILVCSFNTTSGGSLNFVVNFEVDFVLISNSVDRISTGVDTKFSANVDGNEDDNDDDRPEEILVASISDVVTENEDVDYDPLIKNM